jgi:nucleoside-diphosphate-sugar epimerase
MTPRLLFVAGSTGAVGRTVMRLAPQVGASVVPHIRPKSAGERPPLPGAAVMELSETEGLARVLSKCTTVVQLIGTMRKRFASGDTYETSDIGTTAQLVDAAKKAGTIDHFILLSSVGAGRPMGAYLKAKARAEELVRNSGLPWTVFRPSAFIGEGHTVPWVAGALARALGARRYQPIRVEQLASAILKSALERAPLDTVLEGDSLWKQV